MEPKSHSLCIASVDLGPLFDNRLRRLAKIENWTILQTRSPMLLPDLILTRPESLEANSPEAKLPAIAQVPVLVESPSVPTVYLVDPDARPDLPSDRICHTLPPDASDESWVLVIENAARSGRLVRHLHDRLDHLEQLSTTDALTGLYNRMYMLRTLESEFKRYQRTGGSLACIMIDLDHFKNINDTYGHGFGDQVLIAFSNLLRESIRQSDIAGRYGGEEFVCILPNTDVQGAYEVAEKIRVAIESHDFSPGYFRVELTSSFGVANATKEIATPGELVQKADRALYQAKQTGRNRVCMAGPGNANALVQTSFSASPPATGPARGKKPLLIVAHSDAQGMALWQNLRDLESFEVIGVAESDGVIECLQRDQPAIVLAQEDLQPLSGWKLAEQIRRLPKDQYVPIAVVQKAGGESPASDPPGAHPDDVFCEDISKRDLHRRIGLLLQLRLLHDRFYETYERLINARSRLVKAERLNGLGQMASGVAHDFNNVLNAILGRTERLLNITKDESVAAELRIIEEAATEGARTIKRIQEFSRSIVEVDAREVSMTDLIDDCLLLTRARWKDAADRDGITFNISNEVDPALATAANPAELREVVLNLLVNAFDAMVSGGSIEIVSTGEADDARFGIEFRDDGPGMEASVAERVFEPFYTTKNERGTGLGLSVAYGIMTRLGGEIQVDSTPGQGTTFRLEFPQCAHIEAMGGATPVSAVPVEFAIAPATTKLDILVVEDEPCVRQLFVEVLREEGHRVFEASCAREGMALAEVHEFDCVLTDLSMPDLPGWDVARFVKDRSPQTVVLLCSGWGDEYSDEYLASRGVDQWLPKPVSLKELFSVLDDIQPLGAEANDGPAEQTA